MRRTLNLVCLPHIPQYAHLCLGVAFNLG